eukprot:6212383-Pleurochrysis_carterae.AAC.1
MSPTGITSEVIEAVRQIQTHVESLSFRQRRFTVFEPIHAVHERVQLRFGDGILRGEKYVIKLRISTVQTPQVHPPASMEYILLAVYKLPMQQGGRCSQAKP